MAANLGHLPLPDLLRLGIDPLMTHSLYGLLGILIMFGPLFIRTFVYF